MEKEIKDALRKFTISEEEFRDMISVRRMSDVAVGKQLGVTSVTVQHWRKKFGVEREFIRKEAPVRESKPRRKPRLSEDELKTMYSDQRLSQLQIAKMYGVSQATVGNWLEKYGIDPWGNGGRVTVILDKEELRRLYHDDQMIMVEIAKHLKCGESTVRQNLIRYGLMLDPKEVTRRRLANNKDVYPGRYVGKEYVQVRSVGHPNAGSHGYIAEHRLVAEAGIGRPVSHEEQVHHINMRKLDNRIENLAVLPDRDAHRKVHHYIERVSVYLLGLSDERPAPLVFEQPVFWGGEWLTSIDLIARKESRPSLFAKWVRANGVKYEIEDAA